MNFNHNCHTSTPSWIASYPPTPYPHTKHAHTVLSLILSFSLSYSPLTTVFIKYFTKHFDHLTGCTYNDHIFDALYPDSNNILFLSTGLTTYMFKYCFLTWNSKLVTVNDINKQYKILPSAEMRFFRNIYAYITIKKTNNLNFQEKKKNRI